MLGDLTDVLQESVGSASSDTEKTRGKPSTSLKKGFWHDAITHSAEDRVLIDHGYTLLKSRTKKYRQALC